MQSRNHPELARARELLRAGQHHAAMQAFSRLLKRQPNNPDVLHGLGLSRAQEGDHAGAIRALEKALRARPTAPPLLVDLGQVLMGAGRYDRAEAAFGRALRVDPDSSSSRAALCELHLLTGEYDRAGEVVEAGLERRPTDLRLALALARLAPRLGAERRAIELLESHLNDAFPTPFAAMAVHFRLADQHDRLGEHDRAFELYRKANDLFPGRFDPALHGGAVERMMSGWAAARGEGVAPSGRAEDLPVFIVGMPRSGTSLVEQILACHPEVFGGGELSLVPLLCERLAPGNRQHESMIVDPEVLTKPVVDRHARALLGEFRKLSPKASRITDKLPTNFLHLGLIGKLFPRARVIHCVRDPLDTCLSCYFQWFQSGLHWSYRLEWLGAYFGTYQRLMGHWKAALPEMEILDVVYEDLVEDQEAWSRRIVEFVGLDWDEACLRFHKSKRISATLSNEQVRRPMYKSSIGRHRHYERHLGPLRRALGLDETAQSP